MDDAMVRARRALELGRLRTGLTWGAVVTLALAVLVVLVPTEVDARWLVLPFATWTFVVWRGGALARGGIAGLVAGIAGWLVPLSILRPCCAGVVRAAGETCCTRPECCVEAGAVLGLLVALALPLDVSRGRRSIALQIAGAIAVAASTLGARCAGLFVGEAFGLVGGLALGAVIVGAARAILTRPSLA